jgi:hypothetical protein
MLFYVMIVILLVALVWITRIREDFVNIPSIPDVDLKNLPNPQDLLKKMRVLLDKYDKPEVWDHAAQVMDKDPGQLARMNLGILNGQ